MKKNKWEEKEIGQRVLPIDGKTEFMIAALPDARAFYLVNVKTGLPNTSMIAMAYLQTWFGWESYRLKS